MATRGQKRRVQQITAADAVREGCKYPRPRERFAELWDQINGRRCSWDSNPWVWAVGFRRRATT